MDRICNTHIGYTYIYIYLLIYPIELSLKHDSPSQASNDGGHFCLELHNPFFSTGFFDGKDKYDFHQVNQWKFLERQPV